jgi:hypothetical protein
LLAWTRVCLMRGGQQAAGTGGWWSLLEPGQGGVEWGQRDRDGFGWMRLAPGVGRYGFRGATRHRERKVRPCGVRRDRSEDERREYAIARNSYQFLLSRRKCRTFFSSAREQRQILPFSRTLVNELSIDLDRTAVQDSNRTHI